VPPEHAGHRAGAGLEPQQADRGLHLQQGPQQDRRIVVVDAFGIGFFVAGPHETLDVSDQLLVVAGQ